MLNPTTGPEGVPPIDLSRLPQYNPKFENNPAKYERLKHEDNALAYMKRIVEMNRENPPGNEVATRFIQLIKNDPKVFKAALKALPTLNIGSEYTIFNSDVAPFSGIYSQITHDPVLINIFLQETLKRVGMGTAGANWNPAHLPTFIRKIEEYLKDPHLDPKTRADLLETQELLQHFFKAKLP